MVTVQFDELTLTPLFLTEKEGGSKVSTFGLSHFLIIPLKMKIVCLSERKQQLRPRLRCEG